MNTRIASIALLCLAAPLLAQSDQPQAPAAPATALSDTGEAKVVISAPSVIRVGELARLNVAESVADSFKWLLVPQTPDFLVFDAGARAVFSARTPGDYQFIVACAKDGTVDVITHIIRVVGVPVKPLPADRLGKWIPYWNWELGLPTEECARLADSFESIAARGLVGPDEWIKATAEGNRNALGDRIEAWKPMLDQIGNTLLRQAENGGLSTPEQHKMMWLEIAAGLRDCEAFGPTQ